MRRRSAFTLVESVAVCVLLAAGSAGTLVLSQPGGEPDPMSRARASARQIKCATNVRQIVIALVTFANNNKDMYPQPSRLDMNNATIPGGKGAEAAAKDTTGNILSVLIFNASISPEVCVSPAEASSKIKVDAGYQVDKPSGAAKPEMALWDPKFAGTPEQAGARVEGEGNNSYAHAVPMGDRASVWSSTFNSTEAVFGNRGPGYQRVTKPKEAWLLNPKGGAVPGEDSVTLKIHGKPDRWEGNVGYNDAHVNFETRPDPIDVTYRRSPAAGIDRTSLTIADNLFENEADDATREGKLDDPLSGKNQWLVMISGVKVEEGKVKATMFKD